MIWIEVNTLQGRSTVKVDDLKTVLAAMRDSQPLAATHTSGAQIIVGPDALRNAVIKVCSNA